MKGIKLKRIKEITSSLGITEDFITVRYRTLTSISIDYEFVWDYHPPSPLEFQNLNHCMSYYYSIGFNLENYTNEEIVKRINNDLKNVLIGIKESFKKDTGGSLDVKCYLKNQHMDQSLEINIGN